jgi:hypothetical protein
MVLPALAKRSKGGQRSLAFGMLQRRPRVSKALVVDDQTFAQEVLNSDKPVLVYFWLDGTSRAICSRRSLNRWPTSTAAW